MLRECVTRYTVFDFIYGFAMLICFGFAFFLFFMRFEFKLHGGTVLGTVGRARERTWESRAQGPGGLLYYLVYGFTVPCAPRHRAAAGSGGERSDLVSVL